MSPPCRITFEVHEEEKPPHGHLCEQLVYQTSSNSLHVQHNSNKLQDSSSTTPEPEPEPEPELEPHPLQEPGSPC